jgi:hypothetical protein
MGAFETNREEKLESLRKKIDFLRREETEYYQKASVKEAIDVLIESVEFLLEDSGYEC